MSSLIIIACFVVAIAAFIGLFFSLRERTPAVASEKKPTVAEAVPEKKKESVEAKNTVLLTDSEPANRLETTVLANSENVPHEAFSTASVQDSDTDEVDYADLPTIRSISSYNVDGREQSAVHEGQLQNLLEELRNLHQQMQSIEQRITLLTNRVEELSGSDEEHWDAASPTVKVPAQ